MKKMFCIIMVATLMAGCVGQLQRVNKKNPAAIEKADEDGCNYEAIKAVGNPTNPIDKAMREAQISSECMKVKGWEWVEVVKK